MVDLHVKNGASLVAVQNVARSETGLLRHRLDEAAAGAPRAHDRHRGEAQAAGGALDPGVVGRYILSPRIFDFLEDTRAGRGRARSSSPTRSGACSREEPVFAYEFRGRRYDCGSKLGYLEATVDYALRHEEVGRGVPRLPRQARPPGTEGAREPRRGAGACSHEADLVCPAEEVRAAVARLAGEITARLEDEFPVVLSVMGGAAIFTGQLLPLLALPARVRRHRGDPLRQHDGRAARSTGASRRRTTCAAARCS